MTRNQEAINSMAYKVVEEMTRHFDTWKQNKSITQAVEKIKTLLAEIETVNTNQQTTSTGATKKKTQIRKELDKITNVFYGSFRSYARSINDVQLYDKYDQSLTKIKETKDTEVIGFCQANIEFATEKLDQLKDFGTTQELINQYQTTINEFEKIIAVPQTIIAERKTLTQKLKDLFKTLDEYLSQDLDNLMIQYITTNPEFYSDYQNARIIYDSATIHKSLIGTVYEGHELTHVVQYVQVAAKFKAGSELSDSVKSTSAKGNYQFKSLPEGLYSITFSKNGYQTQIIDIEIHKGKTTRLNVHLIKN